MPRNANKNPSVKTKQFRIDQITGYAFEGANAATWLDSIEPERTRMEDATRYDAAVMKKTLDRHEAVVFVAENHARLRAIAK